MADVLFIGELVAKLATPNTIIVSVGCDVGIGRMVRDYCDSCRFNFLGISCLFNQFHAPNGDRVFVPLPTNVDPLAAYMSRNYAIWALCVDFHLFVSKFRRGTVEHLLNIVTTLRSPGSKVYKVYDESREVVREGVVSGTADNQSL